MAMDIISDICIFLCCTIHTSISLIAQCLEIYFHINTFSKYIYVYLPVEVHDTTIKGNSVDEKILFLCQLTIVNLNIS